MKELAVRLEKALNDYGVEGQVTEIHPGPVVTMYEFVPGAGHHASAKIASLSRRPGHGAARPSRCASWRPSRARRAVGIEMPNRDARNRLPEGDLRRRRVPARRRQAAAGARQGHRGPHRGRATWPRCRTCSSPAPPAPARSVVDQRHDHCRMLYRARPATRCA
ncbi:MAG: hypothetical protein MZV70_17260 [Desulfobacterales bacterium]|nr:hypothetical protein [Desulfobacterales bacterium]